MVGGSGDSAQQLDRLFRKQVNLYLLQCHVDDQVTSLSALGGAFCFSEVIIQKMHSIGMNELLPREGDPAGPGEYRTKDVVIENSNHQPPSTFEVKRYMAEYVEYINDNWNSRDLIHLGAFSMWRLNWIHPFANGNGRTSRAIAYFIMCMKQGAVFPGDRNVAARIIENRDAYYRAHHEADRNYKNNQTIDLSALEVLLGGLLQSQLAEYFSKGGSAS